MRGDGPGWFASLLGAAVLIVGGFALGLVAGVVSEEPELVVGHLVGHSEDVPWSREGGTDTAAAPAENAPGATGEASGSRVAEAPRPAPPEAGAAPERTLPPVAAGPPAPVARPSETRPKPGAGAVRGGFAVQVGAFADGAAAQSMLRKLQGKGFDAYVVPNETSGDGRWRVRVGPVATRNEADALATRLKSEEHLPTWVLTEGGG